MARIARCKVPGCSHVRPPSRSICGTCWERLPVDVQDELRCGPGNANDEKAIRAGLEARRRPLLRAALRRSLERNGDRDPEEEEAEEL